MLRPMSASWPRAARLTVSVVLVTAVMILLAPWPARFGPQRTGDPILAARAAQLAGDDQRQGMAVAVLEHGQLTTAGLGTAGAGRPVQPDTPFQIGSVTKTLTAAVLADMVADNTVRPGNRLRELHRGQRRREPDKAARGLRVLQPRLRAAR
jgi:CubicO group peptidase (beta-lactamase class C family)